MDFKKYIIIMFIAVCVFGCASVRSGFGTDLTIVPEGTKESGADTASKEFITEDISSDEKTGQDDPIMDRQGEEISAVTVYVCGEVLNFGVYTLPSGSRVIDAVEAAGGFTEDACESCINLADFLYDGEMIDILSVQNAHQSEVITDASDGLININTADAGLLKTLPGIGDSKANAIILYRQEHGFFTSIEDIMKIDGIKEGIFNSIRDYITV